MSSFIFSSTSWTATGLNVATPTSNLANNIAYFKFYLSCLVTGVFEATRLSSLFLLIKVRSEVNFCDRNTIVSTTCVNVHRAEFTRVATSIRLARWPTRDTNFSTRLVNIRQRKIIFTVCEITNRYRNTHSPFKNILTYRLHFYSFKITYTTNLENLVE